MKSKQGSYTRRALLAGLIATSGILAASAYAVSVTTEDDKPRYEARQLHQGEAGRDDRRAAHLAGLKQKLGLSAEQEAAWNTFAAATQYGARRSGMERGAMRGDFDKLSTPGRFDRMLAMSELRSTHLVKRPGNQGLVFAADARTAARIRCRGDALAAPPRTSSSAASVLNRRVQAGTRAGDRPRSFVAAWRPGFESR